MSAEGVKKFVAAIDLVYPAPQYDGDKTRKSAWLALMTQTLGGASDDVLAAAATDILRNRDPKKDGRFFPTPKECAEACTEAAERITRERMALLEHKTPEMPHHARVALARDLMQAPLGKQARKEGWEPAMFNFCINNQRAPQGREIDECKRISKEFAADYERLLKGEHPFGGPLARLAESMVRKARELMGDVA